MMKTVFTTCAASALLLASQAAVLPVFAQDAEATKDELKLEETQPATPETAEEEQPAMDDSTVAAIPTDDDAATGMFIQEQDDASVAASDYMGAAVSNYSGEEIGDVNDVILSPEGNVEAVVVGVGGFLGLGERNVAIAFEAVKIVNDPEAGDFALRIDASKDQLAAAPEFLTVAEKVAMKRAEEAEREAQRPIDLNNTAPATE